MIRSFDVLVVRASWTLLGVLALKAAVFVVLSRRHAHRDDIASAKALLAARPRVSVLVPCYNEEAVLENCVQSLLRQRYDNIEVIVVDDGSTDGTCRIGDRLARQHPDVVYFFTKPNGGKASALNHGLRHSTGELIVCMDADSVFEPDAVHYLIAPFADERVGAVGGNVKVANRSRFLNRHQAMEYVSGLNLQRRAFASLGCMQVISGAIGAFRRSALLAIGGYSNDTVAEDMDVTIAMAEAGHKVAFASRAVAHTEAPERISDWARQRYRWTYGGIQVVRKYKHMLLRRRYGRMAFIGLPYFALFPWIDVAVSALFVASIVRVCLGGSALGLVAFYAVLATAQATLAIYAAWMDGKERVRSAWSALLDSLWYNHLITYVTVRAGVNFLFGRSVRWNKSTRLGKNTVGVLDLTRLERAERPDGEVIIDLTADEQPPALRITRIPGTCTTDTALSGHDAQSR